MSKEGNREINDTLYEKDFIRENDTKKFMVLSAFSINSGDTSVKATNKKDFLKLNDSTIDRNTGEIKGFDPNQSKTIENRG